MKNLIFVSQDWAEIKNRVAKEKALVREVVEWVKKEPPPCKIRISPDNGYRVFVYPDTGATDEEKHKLLAWLVRNSGKKFTRFLREGGRGEVVWWNGDGGSENRALKSGQAIILLENGSLGKCRIVEVEKVVKVKELVCDDGDGGEK